MNKRYTFNINMPYAKCQELYNVDIKYIVVEDLNGKRIQLLKKHILRFLSPSGIHGVFTLEVDQNNSFKSIEKNA
ncbi:DUF2835 family protein [Agaribacter flavus]|uniref:DUF2835 family protein n=1 Tax=Agaribacter flavus TaxID=1902781 RepID=A0ABV7FMW7_9ALTE